MGGRRGVLVHRRWSSVSRRKTSTTVYLEQGQVDRLKLLNSRTKFPVAEYIRQGIELVLAKYDHVLPGQETWFGVSSVLPEEN